MGSEPFINMFIRSGLEQYAEPREPGAPFVLRPLSALESRPTGPHTAQPYVYPTAFPHRNMWKTVKRLNYSVSVSGTKNIYRESSPGVFDRLSRRIDVTATASGAEDIKPTNQTESAKAYRSGNSLLRISTTVPESVTRRERRYDDDGIVTSDVTTTNQMEISLRLGPLYWDGSNFALGCEGILRTSVAVVAPDISPDFNFRADLSNLPQNTDAGDLSVPEFGSTPFRLDRAENLQLSSNRIEFVSLSASADFTVNERFP